MANAKKDSNCERWEVKDEEKDRHAVAIIDCHVFQMFRETDSGREVLE